MHDEVDFHMTYPCYFLCGDRGGLVCITVSFVTCLCLFTNLKALQSFQQEQRRQQHDSIAFPLEDSFVACHTRNELIDRLNAAESELALSGVHNLAINPEPGQPIAYITIGEFNDALPKD
jgi:hypothetical protein